MRSFGPFVKKFCHHALDTRLPASPTIFLAKLEKLARKPFGDKIPFSAEHVQWNRLSMPIRKQRKKLEAVGVGCRSESPTQDFVAGGMGGMAR